MGILTRPVPRYWSILLTSEKLNSAFGTLNYTACCLCANDRCGRPIRLLLEARKTAPCARLRQARLNRPLSVITTQNKMPPLLRNRQQPYKMSPITIQRKDLIFLQPRQTCELFKRSCWRWHKPTCNLALSSLRGLRRLSRRSNLSVLLRNSRASGAPCF